MIIMAHFSIGLFKQGASNNYSQHMFYEYEQQLFDEYSQHMFMKK